MENFKFNLTSPFQPSGDQPLAIEKLCDGLEKKLTDQVLLGVTGSEKHLQWLILFKNYKDLP